MTRPTHRRVELIGGPLDGCQARVYPGMGGDRRSANRGPTEPATLTLCLGAALPDWRPAAWVTYHRHPDGTYRWIERTDIAIPGAVRAADGLTETDEGEAPTEGETTVSDALRATFGKLGINAQDIDPHALRQALTNPDHTWLKDTP